MSNLTEAEDTFDYKLRNLSTDISEKQISILLVGIGGYGQHYAKSILDHALDGRFFLRGIVDPKPENCEFFSEIKARNIPIFNCIEDFYSEATADLTVISSPIQYHCYQTCYSLQKGSNVLCEKPLCATIQDALKMIKARDAAKKFLAIGYQWSFSDAISQLKQDIAKGIFGRPKRLKTLALSPRYEEYYKRNWAGKKKDSSGNWILDSVANNGTAHFLHNMFYILGKTMYTSAIPAYVTAELYRANAIENFDTSAVRVVTEEGVEIMFFASHAVYSNHIVMFSYEFEKANVSFAHGEEKNNITAVFKDGTRKSYGNPDAEDDDNKKLWECIKAVQEHGNVPCGPEAAISQTYCINGMQESVSEVITVSEEFLKVKENQGKEKIRFIESLDSIFSKCYASWLLPGEMGVPWAKTGKKIDLSGYTYFHDNNREV